MKLTPEQEQAIEDLNLGGHPATAPFVAWRSYGEDSLLIDGVITVAELRGLLAIIDPAGEDAQPAARYRWIRQQKENLMALFPEDENKFGLADVACALSGEALDAAVDAQIEADEARDFKYEDRD